MNAQEYRYYLEKARHKESTGELYHYGIAGQKWGIRRWQFADGRFNEEGKERYFGSKKKEPSNDDSNYEVVNGERIPLILYPYVKWPIPSLAVTAGLVAAVGVGTAINDAIVNKKIKNYEKHLETEEIDKKTGLRLKDHLDKKGNPMDPEREFKDDLSKVNMENKYALWMANRSKGYTQNCMLCTTAMDLRQRGYDVRAGKSPDGFETDELKKWYKNPEIKTSTYNKVISDLKKEPEGSYGNIMVLWANSFGAGHSMFYKIIDGEPKVYCAQTSSFESLSNLSYRVDNRWCSSCRTDNLKPNYKYLKENNLIRY